MNERRHERIGEEWRSALLYEVVSLVENNETVRVTAISKILTVVFIAFFLYFIIHKNLFFFFFFFSQLQHVRHIYITVRFIITLCRRFATLGKGAVQGQLTRYVSHSQRLGHVS